MLYLNRAFRMHTEFSRDQRRRSYYVLYLENGKDYYRLTMPKSSALEINEGLHRELTIGKSRTNSWRVHREDDNELYLLLSSRLTDDDDRIGRIYLPKKQTSEILLRCSTIKEETRRLGWNHCIVRARVGDVFYITWEDPVTSARRDCVYYVQRPDRIQSCRGAMLRGMLKSWGVPTKDLPFMVMTDTYGRSQLKLSEWRQI